MNKIDWQTIAETLRDTLDTVAGGQKIAIGGVAPGCRITAEELFLHLVSVHTAIDNE